jgi:hypothetical protein
MQNKHLNKIVQSYLDYNSNLNTELKFVTKGLLYHLDEWYYYDGGDSYIVNNKLFYVPFKKTSGTYIQVKLKIPTAWFITHNNPIGED